MGLKYRIPQIDTFFATPKESALWFKTLILLDFAYMHSPADVQIPEVWPKTTQLTVHIELPVVLTKNQLHRNPAWLNCKIKAKIKQW